MVSPQFLPSLAILLLLETTDEDIANDPSRDDTQL